MTTWSQHHSKGIIQHPTLCLTLTMLTLVIRQRLVTLGLTLGAGVW